jgi:hypothetical protein
MIRGVGEHFEKEQLFYTAGSDVRSGAGNGVYHTAAAHNPV